MNLIWNKSETMEEINRLLEVLSEEYPIRTEGNGIRIIFKKSQNGKFLKVTRSAEFFEIEYSTVVAAARGLAFAMAGEETDEDSSFKTFGILLDCSRTGVVSVKHFKHWLRRLALMGYNIAMLYTKDAYQVPGETYFGYMRGAYSIEEIRQIDSYAKKIGIEIIASIQALGHLEPILRWPAYDNIKDTDNVLMVDDEKSHELLYKMIKFWSDALGSRRIHLGMDETHDLGRGRFMDKFGYERPFDIYNRHLKKVCDICDKFSLKPMIWSDMYFRLGNENLDYYDKKTVIPEDVKAAIDQRTELVYWDYYHRNEEFYADYIDKHHALGNGPVMASGLWTWARMWYDHEQSVATAGPCMNACIKKGVDEIIFTMWGDDGGYCEFDSAFAGMAWAADYAFNGTKANDARIEKIFQAIFGTSYKLQLEASELEVSVFKEDGQPHYDIRAATVLWDDPLMGIIWHEYLFFDKDVWKKAITKLNAVMEKLAPHRDDTKAGRIDHAWNVCNTLIKKLETRTELLSAYEENDRAKMLEIRDKAIPEVIAAIESLNDSFRKQWQRSYKPYGLEVMQIKLAGLRERYRELARRIGEYLDDENARICELELKPETIGVPDSRYRMIATGGWFI